MLGLAMSRTAQQDAPHDPWNHEGPQRHDVSVSGNTHGSYLDPVEGGESSLRKATGHCRHDSVRWIPSDRD
jgi:hypothetical protein